MWSKQACLEPAEQFCELPGQALGRVLAVGAPVDAHHRDVFHQQDVGRHLRHPPGGEADHSRRPDQAMQRSEASKTSPPTGTKTTSAPLPAVIPFTPSAMFSLRKSTQG